jgi:uncharacterized protein (TIGR02172 family)
MKEISLDKPIAHGRTADVYDWDDGHVLKLFHNWFELENIEYELKIARAVRAGDVKAPAVEELIRVDGRNGLIYERVDGKNMFEVWQQKPWKVFAFAGKLAELHMQMHSNIFQADVPEQRTKLQQKIQQASALPDDLKIFLLKKLESMPDGDRVCHGDFHPGNVLVAGHSTSIIDWIDATRGNPLADVARTSILLLGIAENQGSNFAMKGFVKVFHAAYLRHYFHLHPSGVEQYRHWLPIVAGARLNENIPELEKWLVEKARQVR